MEFVRTQVYLKPQQHRELKEEASRKGVSLAELLRQLADEYLQKQSLGSAGLLSISDLGESGIKNGSVEHDRYIGGSIAKEHIRRHRRLHRSRR